MALALLAMSELTSVVAAEKKPNILFVLTDDQDWHMESMDHMPYLQKYLLNEGTLFSNHFCTVALCCPSRVNMWTGKAAHNTNVTDVFAPYGKQRSMTRLFNARLTRTRRLSQDCEARLS
jgi:arylsulfatase A-like enzyme